MKYLRLGMVQEFPFVEPPDYRSIRDGYQTLHELGAIDERNELTPMGYQLARLPADPRIGRMVLAARDENCLDEVLVIAAALSVQDPRERPMDKANEADEAHRKFRDDSSDFLGFLRLWDFFHDQAKHLSGSKLRKLCQANFLSFVRMREWHDVHNQLKEVVAEMGLYRPTDVAGVGARGDPPREIRKPRPRSRRGRGRRPLAPPEARRRRGPDVLPPQRLSAEVTCNGISRVPWAADRLPVIRGLHGQAVASPWHPSREIRADLLCVEPTKGRRKGCATHVIAPSPAAGAVRR